MKLEGRCAIITGGGRGIGRAVARAFAREGARVALCSRTAAEVERVADELRREFKSEVTHGVCDVSNPADVAGFCRSAFDAFGRGPDILVNNAGIAESAPVTKTSDELWRRHIEIN